MLITCCFCFASRVLDRKDTITEPLMMPHYLYWKELMNCNQSLFCFSSCQKQQFWLIFKKTTRMRTFESALYLSVKKQCKCEHACTNIDELSWTWMSLLKINILIKHWILDWTWFYEYVSFFFYKLNFYEICSIMKVPRS